MAKEIKEAWWQAGVAMFGRLSAWIAVPVLIGIFLGKWLDQKYGTAPWLFLTATGLMFGVSMFGLIKETTQEFKKIEPSRHSEPSGEESHDE